MPFIRSKAPATPTQLLDQARQAQAEHAAALEAANQRLIEDHRAIYAEATNRQAVIREQVELLNAEHEGLDSVVDEVVPEVALPA